jgi:hypothetical protein
VPRSHHHVGVSEPYNRRAFLPDPDGRDLDRARLAVFRRRILVAQVLYALAALVCLASTVASVIALALVQLYFIVSPQRPRAGTRPGADGDDG